MLTPDLGIFNTALIRRLTEHTAKKAATQAALDRATSVTPPTPTPTPIPIPIPILGGPGFDGGATTPLALPPSPVTNALPGFGNPVPAPEPTLSEPTPPSPPLSFAPTGMPIQGGPIGGGPMGFGDPNAFPGIYLPTVGPGLPGPFVPPAATQGPGDEVPPPVPVGSRRASTESPDAPSRPSGPGPAGTGSDFPDRSRAHVPEMPNDSASGSSPAPVETAPTGTTSGGTTSADPRAEIQRIVDEMRTSRPRDRRVVDEAMARYRGLMAPHLPEIVRPGMTDLQAVGAILAQFLAGPREAAEISIASWKVAQQDAYRQNSENQLTYGQQFEQYRDGLERAGLELENARADERAEDEDWYRRQALAMNGLLAQNDRDDRTQSRAEARDENRVSQGQAQIAAYNEYWSRTGGPQTDEEWTRYDDEVRRLMVQYGLKPEQIAKIPRRAKAKTYPEQTEGSWRPVRGAGTAGTAFATGVNAVMAREDQRLRVEGAVRAWRQYIQDFFSGRGVLLPKDEKAFDAVRRQFAAHHGVDPALLAPYRADMSYGQWTAQTTFALGRGGFTEAGGGRVAYQNRPPRSSPSNTKPGSKPATKPASKPNPGSKKRRA